VDAPDRFGTEGPGAAGRVGQDRSADAVLFPASSQSSLITGSNLDVDGGRNQI
jgi:NAD(P)-dependent dehydrogenase (short-subunit alcohol dehydrogenase family)